MFDSRSPSCGESGLSRLHYTAPARPFGLDPAGSRKEEQASP